MDSRVLEEKLRLIPDEQYIKLKFWYKMGTIPNIYQPHTFSEKIQWLKLNDRKDEYTTFVDKIAVKQYVSDKIGAQYIIPTIKVWNSCEEIRLEELPDSFVIKTNHDSGSSILCKNKNQIDFNKIKKELSIHQKENYYLYGREWPYRNVARKIFAEEMLRGEEEELRDYKVFCFNGTPRMIQVDIDRFTNHRRNLYNTNWNYLEFSLGYPTAPEISVNKPERFEEMLWMASALSENMKFLRVDLYEVKGKVYFGEMTLYPGSGFERFLPKNWDEVLGSWLDLKYE